MTARGAIPRALAAAAATAKQPNSSAAGIEMRHRGAADPACVCSAARSATVSAPLASAAATSGGHHADVTHTRPGASAANT
eukprot:2430780-Pleurochrysis_carterae.AAC.1